MPQQHSTVDFLPPFDPTDYVGITGAQLTQLIGGLKPNADTGLVIVTEDVLSGTIWSPNIPNVADTPKWANYVWVRVQPGTNLITAYVWNPNSAPNDLDNWVTLNSASIGPNTIPGSAIQAGTITTDRLQTVDTNLLRGSLPSTMLAQADANGFTNITSALMTNNTPIFGDMNGVGSTCGEPKLGDGVVKLATHVDVPTYSVISGPVPVGLSTLVQAGDVVAVNVGGAGFITTRRAIHRLVDPADGNSAAGQFVAVNGTNDGFAYVSSVGKVQSVVDVWSDQVMSVPFAARTQLTAAVPAYSIKAEPGGWNGGQIYYPLQVAFTPGAPSNTIRIRGHIHGWCNYAAEAPIMVRMFYDTDPIGTVLSMPYAPISIIANVQDTNTFNIPFFFTYVCPATAIPVAATIRLCLYTIAPSAVPSGGVGAVFAVVNMYHAASTALTFLPIASGIALANAVSVSAGVTPTWSDKGLMVAGTYNNAFAGVQSGYTVEEYTS